jgi:hypothetical protein
MKFLKNDGHNKLFQSLLPDKAVYAGNVSRVKVLVPFQTEVCKKVLRFFVRVQLIRFQPHHFASRQRTQTH